MLIDLSAHLSLLPDPTQSFMLDDALARLDEFRPASRRDLITTFSAGVFWLHVRLHYAGSMPATRWLVAGTAKSLRVDYYERTGNDWLVLHSGRGIARDEKPIIAVDPVFPLALMPGAEHEVLLRVDARGATNMETFLWEPTAYRFADSIDLMKLSALLSGFVVCSLLALLAFLRLRETQYLWLGLMLFGLAGLEASRQNFLSTYLWFADRPLPPFTLAPLALLAFFSLSKVVSHALNLPGSMPRANRLLTVLRWAAVIGALIAPFQYGEGVRIMSLAVVAHNLATIAFTIECWRCGYANARIFLLAFFLALATETARQMANLGWLPFVGAMAFSTHFFLLAAPLILVGLVERTRQLRERLLVAERVQAAKSAFFARVSHELRSPLNTILGYSRMLGRNSAKLSLAEGTRGIESSTLRLLRQIDELLDEARAEAGQLRISPGQLALRPWLEEIAQSTRIVVEERNNHLNCHFQGDLAIDIKADGERLRQVLDNLLANANRHTHNGTLSLTCQALADADEAVLNFMVEDDGEGIPVETLQSIFEPFIRGQEEGCERGFGLGLPICRELVRQMGGEISAQSTPGQGSQFVFSLRLPVIGPSPPVVPSQLHAGPPPSNSPHILLVDDDAGYLDQLREICEDAGFSVETASGGNAALTQLRTGEWHLVVTDQMMPETDGWSVLREARALQPGVPVVLLSSAAPRPPENLPTDMRFDATLLKPGSSEAILETLWHLVIKVATGETKFDWGELARLTREGDVSAMEEWIAAGRADLTDCDNALIWVESLVNRLELPLLARVTTKLACLPLATG